MIFIELNRGKAKGAVCPSLARLTVLFGEALALRGREKMLKSVSVAFVGRAEMTRLNEAYHGGQGVTDVLSFPASGKVTKGYLGEIVVYLPRAIAQAKARGIAVRKEVELLLVHGFLHLLGFDHNTPSRQNTMSRAQVNLLGTYADLALSH